MHSVARASMVVAGRSAWAGVSNHGKQHIDDAQGWIVLEGKELPAGCRAECCRTIS